MRLLVVTLVAVSAATATAKKLTAADIIAEIPKIKDAAKKCGIEINNEQASRVMANIVQDFSLMPSAVRRKKIQEYVEKAKTMSNEELLEEIKKKVKAAGVSAKSFDDKRALELVQKIRDYIRENSDDIKEAFETISKMSDKELDAALQTKIDELKAGGATPETIKKIEAFYARFKKILSGARTASDAQPQSRAGEAGPNWPFRRPKKVFRLKTADLFRRFLKKVIEETSFVQPY